MQNSTQDIITETHFSFAKKCWRSKHFWLKFWDLSGAKVCRSCRSRRELCNEYLVAKFDFDTAENEPGKVCPLCAYRSPRCFSWLCNFDDSSIQYFGNWSKKLSQNGISYWRKSQIRLFASAQSRSSSPETCRTQSYSLDDNVVGTERRSVDRSMKRSELVSYSPLPIVVFSVFSSSPFLKRLCIV